MQVREEARRERSDFEMQLMPSNDKCSGRAPLEQSMPHSENDCWSVVAMT